MTVRIPRWALIAAALLVAIGVGVGATLLLTGDDEKAVEIRIPVEGESSGDGVTLPIVVGLEEEAGKTRLEQAGFKVDFDRRQDPSPAGTIFRQVPSSGSADKGSTVTLFVSTGP